MILNKLVLYILIVLPSSTISCQDDQEPVGFLIPPPVSPSKSQSIHRSVSTFQFPVAQRAASEIYNGQTDAPGLMQRVARWFGYESAGYQNTLSNVSPENFKDESLHEIQSEIFKQQQKPFSLQEQQQVTQQQHHNPQKIHHHQQQHSKNTQQVQHVQQKKYHKQEIQNLSQPRVQNHHTFLQENHEKAVLAQLPMQQLTQASFYQPQYKEKLLNIAPYQYNQPKINCNPCNKIPWIPMWPALLNGYSRNQLQQQKPEQQQQKENSFSAQNLPKNIQISPGQSSQSYSGEKNYLEFDSRNQHQLRAVRFNGPGMNVQPIPRAHFSIPSIPIPNLSAYPLPPLLNAEIFRNYNHTLTASASNNEPYIAQTEEPSKIKQISPAQILISTQPALHNQQNLANSGHSTFEIIKSVALGDYASSIEYPIKLTQSPVIDLTKDNSNSQTTFDEHNVKHTTDNEVPTLIELGSFEGINQYASETSSIQYVTQLPDNYFLQPKYQPITNTEATKNQDNYQLYNGEQTQNIQQEIFSNYIQPTEQFNFIGPITSLLPPTQTPTPNFFSSPIIVKMRHEPSDNYPEASSHNLTVKAENKFDFENLIPGPTFRPQTESFNAEATTSEQPYQQNYNKESEESATSYDIVPSLETASEYPDLFKDFLEKPKTTTPTPFVYSHNDEIFPGKPFTRAYDNLKININSQTQWAFQPTPTSTYSSIDASGKYAGMSPPSEFQVPLVKFSESEKKPKQFQQLIIPYTTKIKPRPFKTREDNLPIQQSQKNISVNRYTNWANSNEHHEIHDQQESKLVSSIQTTEQQTPKTTKYLTKILASNIRELLRREHARRNHTYKENSIADSSENNLKYLQNNIDGWTEQEYTSIKGKGSTVSIQKSSKIIPNEYLTTTQSIKNIRNEENTRTSTERLKISTVTTPKPMKVSTMLNFKDDIGAHLENHSISNSITNNIHRLEVYTKSYMKNRTSVLATTTLTPSTSSTTFKTQADRSLTSAIPFYHRTMQPSKPANDKELWQKLKVSISPLTNEKVYVVTPVPRTTSTTAISSDDDIVSFKSPRFIVRPAPATFLNESSSATEDSEPENQISHENQKFYKEKSNLKPYTPELFGLMGLSAFVPDEPADIQDGHSRVITVVTPTPHNRKRSINYIKLHRATPPRLPLSS